jgi:GT2 family glycosyltransferase
MSLPKVSIIIVNWNGKRYLKECFDSVFSQTYPNYEVVFVDNGSTDGSVEYIETNFPQTRIVRLDKNYGFAAPNNIGIKEAFKNPEVKYIATLNNDTKVDPNWLKELMNVSIEHENDEIGMYASKMLFYNNPNMINSTGISINMAMSATDRMSCEIDNLKNNHIEEIFGPCAGAALYSRTLLEDIGLFDEDYFAYLEDVDLAWRARLRGWECLYVPTAIVYHNHSSTGIEGSSFKLFHLGKNKIQTLIKNLLITEFVRYLPFIIVYDTMPTFYYLFIKRDLTPMRGRIFALKNLKQILEKRQTIQKRKLTSRYSIYKFIKFPESPLKRYQRRQHLLKIVSSNNCAYQNSKKILKYNL